MVSSQICREQISNSSPHKDTYAAHFPHFIAEEKDTLVPGAFPKEPL